MLCVEAGVRPEALSLIHTEARSRRSTTPTSGYETEGHRFESCRARLSRRGSCLQIGHIHLQKTRRLGGTEITPSDVSRLVRPSRNHRARCQF